MATDLPRCSGLSRRALVRQAGALAAAPWLLRAGQAAATERSGDLIGETTFYRKSSATYPVPHTNPNSLEVMFGISF